MVRIFRHYVSVQNVILAAIDVAILYLAVYAGLYFRWTNFHMPSSAVTTHLPDATLFVFVIVTMMFATGLYRRHVQRDWAAILARLTVSFGLALVVLALVFYMLPFFELWRSALVLAIGLAMIGIMVVHLLFLSAIDLQALKRQILVLGAGEKAARIEVLERQDLSRGSFRCVGYLQVNSGPVRIADSRLVTGLNRLSDYVKRHDIDEIVVAIDDRRGQMPVQSLLECRLNGITITDFLSFHERETGRVNLEGLYPSWLIFSDGRDHRFATVLIKRFFDLAISAVFLAFTSPLILLTAIAIKLDSRGPLFYRQQRVGQGGAPFMLLKFRSMRDDAEIDGTPQWAGRDDPRVTRVGAFIRRTRIDEIPQIFNVIKGDMSLVGPRPERPFFVNQLRREIPYYLERHRIKPGITGWAQINYQYTATITDTTVKTEYDLYYVKNCSLFLDLIIVLQTLRVVLWPQGVR